MRVMRPRAMVAEMTTPCAKPGASHSPAYLALPVTLARPSTREIGRPRYVVAVMPLSRSRDPLVRLRLRRAARRLRQRAHDAAPRQLDLEVVATEAPGRAEQRVGGAAESLRRRGRADELRLGRGIAPRLVRDA